MRERVVIVCPGRGTYTKTELGYLKPYRPGIDPWIQSLDGYLKKAGAPTVSELDNAAQFSPAIHTPGENASTLIYACSLADFLAVDPERYEIVAVTGNSLGWYTALTLGGALSHQNGMHLIYTMGSMMKSGVIGGQIVYPITRDDWTLDPEKVAVVESAIQEVWDKKIGAVYPSIRFGGFAVIGGDEEGIRYLMGKLPKFEERYPMRLVNHAAFHTPVLQAVADRAKELLPIDLFEKPKYPLVDGRGAIWQPYSTNIAELYAYTLGHQITQTYDFTKAITVCLKEFGPDKVVLVGPGSTTGGAIGQIFVKEQWLGMGNKKDFARRQEENPYLISMGLLEQRARVTKH